MILHWVIIIIFVFIAFFLFRIEHAGRKMKIIAIFLILVLIFLSIFILFSSKKFDLNSPKGIANAVYSYVSWVGKSISNLWNAGGEVKDIVGNAIKTNSTK